MSFINDHAPEGYEQEIKTYYSYSRLWKYLRDPEEYYRHYVLKLKEPPNENMVLGTLFASAYSGQRFADTNPKLKFNLKDALINPQKYVKNCPDGITFTSDKLRVMENVLKDKKLVKFKAKHCEQTVLVESKICPLQAKHDGRNEKFKGTLKDEVGEIKLNRETLIIENKYGTPWNEERANTEDQIIFYAYVDFLATGNIPWIRVQTADRKTGRINVFNVKVSKAQFIALEKKIEYAYNGIINKVWKKLS